MKKVITYLLAIVTVLIFSTATFAENNTVYSVKLDKNIDQSSVTLVERGISEASSNGGSLLVVEIDTYGGLVDSAIAIKSAILSAPVKTVTFVNKKAISAGSLIALSGEELFMSKGSAMGAAEARLGDEKADIKVMSMWTTELATTAEARGKNPQIARAMADSDIAIPGLVDKGKLLTLSDQEALKHGMADYEANSLDDICKIMKVENPSYQTVTSSMSEKFASFITNPVVASALMAIGIIAIVVEIFAVGFGVSGAIGILCFGLYFVGHLAAGYAGWIPIIIFIIGVVLIAIEAFVVPGFGVTGVAGLAAIFGSIVLTAQSFALAMMSIVVALIVSVLVISLSIKYGKTNKMWRKLILKDRTDADSGYHSAKQGYDQYIGMSGVSVTPLRPAGTAIIDGKRFDVVTEGNFIPSDIGITVIAVEGVRIIVKENN